jgi:acid phosphatase
VIVVLENKNYNQVIGSSYMPFLNSLATKYALATNFYANGIDSLPNYFMMTVGSTITTGSTYNAVVNDNNVVRVLTTAGKSWKAYAESIPSVGYLGPSQPPYVKVHNPFAYFSDIVNDAEAAKNIVGMDQFATDLAAGKLPNYAFVIPNNSSNSHDCPPTMTTCTSADTLKYSDDWLKAHVQPLIDSDSWPSTLLIVTYDESAGDTTNGGGRVVTVVAGTKVNSGYQITTMMQHEAILRLSLKALGLTDLPGQAATAPDMDGAFKTALPLP